MSLSIWACSSDSSDTTTTTGNDTNQTDTSNTNTDNTSGDTNNNTNTDSCVDQIAENPERGACDQTLPDTPSFSQSVSGSTRSISSNNIPKHMVGLFGGGQGSLNPNAISAQNSSYSITTNPQVAASLTPLLNSSGTGRQGPQYAFGILLNGVELDPIAAEPWPHTRDMSDPNLNWEWNLEALVALLGLDCNNAHVQPNGKYHYHGSPVLYLKSINIPCNKMTLIGYAADGFLIYYKYAYTSASDATTDVVAMTSSYRLKSGNRPGDGTTAPNGAYDGEYSNDYEYVDGLGTLGEANGRVGVTPEYPEGTFYYVITDDFPSVPRYFKGTPSNDFAIGGGA